MGCPIGAMVMGFELPPAKQEELMGLVGDMCSLAYIREEEIPHIPHFDPGPQGAVYGPLAIVPARARQRDPVADAQADDVSGGEPGRHAVDRFA